MSWTRFDDRYTSARLWTEVSYEARWHYHALVELCCATDRYDGLLPLRMAERASDVSDPRRCHDELERVGLVEVTDLVRITTIGGHVPPEGQRPENLLPRKRKNTADWRRRRCEAGQHSKDCPKKTCPVKLSVAALPVTHVDTDVVTPGRVGSGLETPTTQLKEEQEQDEHARVRRLIRAAS